MFLFSGENVFMNVDLCKATYNNRSFFENKIYIFSIRYKLLVTTRFNASCHFQVSTHHVNASRRVVNSNL